MRLVDKHAVETLDLWLGEIRAGRAEVVRLEVRDDERVVIAVELAVLDASALPEAKPAGYHVTCPRCGDGQTFTTQNGYVICDGCNQDVNEPAPAGKE